MDMLRKQTSVKAEALFREAEQCEEKGDFGTAFNRLMAAAKLGDPASYLNLGNYYASGTGTAKDLKKAAYWYKKAYQNGFSSGALNLAIDRRNEGNLRSAIVWFKKAIEMNSGDACIELAKIYGARKGGQRAAAQLLRRALQMTKDEISDDARKKAEPLLETAQTRFRVNDDLG